MMPFGFPVTTAFFATVLLVVNVVEPVQSFTIGGTEHGGILSARNPLQVQVRHHQQQQCVTPSSLVLLKMTEDNAEDASSSTATSEYAGLTVPKLKEVCREKGLPVSGTKAQLLERLQESLVDGESSAIASDDDDDDDEIIDDEINNNDDDEKASSSNPMEDEKPLFFTDLGLSSEALSAIERQDRWHLPTPIQQLAIPRLLGCDTRKDDETDLGEGEYSENSRPETNTAFWCEAPTGSGKTAAFVLPLLQKILMDRHHQRSNSPTNQPAGITSLILCPTRELATQIGDVLSTLASDMTRASDNHQKPLNVQVITGGVRREDQIAQLADSVDQGRAVDVVIATPGRLVDVLTQYKRTVTKPTTRFKKERKLQQQQDNTMEDDDESFYEDGNDDEDNDNDKDDEPLGASDAALERRLLAALDDADRDKLSLDAIQSLQLDRDDDEGRDGLAYLLHNLQYLVLDEADRLLGRAFEGEVNAVLDLLGSSNTGSSSSSRSSRTQTTDKVVQTWLFSATFPKIIEPRVESVLAQLGQTSTTRISCANSDRLLEGGAQEEVSETLKRKLQSNPNPNSQLLQVGPASTIQMRTIEMEQRDRTQVLKNLWLANEDQWRKGGVLVFCGTRYSAEHVSRKLRRVGIRSSELHGKLDQDARVRRLADLQSGKIHVLLATDLASRGLDVVGLSAVVNYDLPRSTADFVHRVGRTGRAGRPGVAITFVTPTTESHFDLIEQRHIPVPAPRETMQGFEVDEANWRIRSQGAKMRAPGAGHSDKDLAHDRMFGGIKGKKRSKKDKLREMAAEKAEMDAERAAAEEMRLADELSQ